MQVLHIMISFSDYLCLWTSSEVTFIKTSSKEISMCNIYDGVHNYFTNTDLLAKVPHGYIICHSARCRDFCSISSLTIDSESETCCLLSWLWARVWNKEQSTEPGYIAGGALAIFWNRMILKFIVLLVPTGGYIVCYNSLCE